MTKEWWKSLGMQVITICLFVVSINLMVDVEYPYLGAGLLGGTLSRIISLIERNKRLLNVVVAQMGEDRKLLNVVATQMGDDLREKTHKLTQEIKKELK